VVVTAGPLEDRGVAVAPEGEDSTDSDAVELGGWSRAWGLVVPAGNPDDVSGLADLVDRDLSFVNRGADSGLRTSLASALADLADERGVDRHEVTDAVRGWDLTARAFESPARSVAAGDAEAGLGLRATATKLGLGFVPVGTEQVRVLANPDRTDKPAVERLADELDDVDDALVELDGFDTA
jgi:putative molybdopterin biosynthesis protein